MIVHDREAHGDCLAIIKEFPTVTGVFHCFSGSPEMAAELLKKGRTSVRGMWSEKKQTAYDAAVILCDTGGRYIDFKLEFPKNKRS